MARGRAELTKKRKKKLGEKNNFKTGFTEWARSQTGKLFYNDPRAKLTKPQEVGAGIVGGVLACWNHPIGELERERENES